MGFASIVSITKEFHDLVNIMFENPHNADYWYPMSWHEVKEKVHKCGCDSIGLMSDS